jgi:tetratricopeptide (TPR) repeat protein
MNRASLWLTGLLVGTNVVLVQQAVVAKSPVEVGRIAKAMTVAIKTVGTTNVGSGILLQRQGDVYTVLTAGHVVSKPQGVFTIKTADGQVHRAIAGSVRLPGSKLDLAVLKFRSSNKYTLVKIGTSNTLEELSPIYVAGYPAESTDNGKVVIEGETFTVTEGKVTGKATKGNEKGYSLIYSNITRPGMSGGPVLNEEGELVAIHGQGDREDDGAGGKTGLNLGIVVERFGSVEVALGVRSEQQIAALPLSTQLNASDYFVSGNDKYNNGDFRGALADYNQVLALNPKNSNTYYNRGNLKKEKLNDVPGALSDYNQAIALNPKYSKAYNNRGNLKDEKLNDVQGALSDYNQAIALNPKYSDAYNNRGLLKNEKLNDVEGALSDYNQAIALDPKDSFAYNNRGNLKNEKLNDVQGALSDYNQAITLNPKNSEAYNNLGNLKNEKLNDVQGALADFNQAIFLNPKYSEAYNNRGVLKKNKLNDVQGALSDSNQAIALNPKYSDAYYNRGNLKNEKLNDVQGALSDYNQAIALNPKNLFAYNNRGVLKKNKLNDVQGALSDYNQAIALNPKYSNAYNNRGILKYVKLNDVQGAIQDFRQAARLYREQGQAQYLQDAIDRLRQLGAVE